MSEIDLTGKITKTCPFLGKLCIGDDCPSFTVDDHSYRKTRDGVLLLKKVKGKIFTKTEEVAMAIQFAWSFNYTPRCKVLGKRDGWGHNSSLVGEKLEIIREIKPRWIRVNCWDSSYKKVTELPEIKGETDE